MLKFNSDPDKLKKEFREAAAGRLVSIVNDTKCPEHGKTATIVAKDGRFEISECCCEKLKTLIESKLK